MKKNLFLLFFFGSTAMAQVNLDRVIQLGPSNQAYPDAKAANVYYFFPAQLCRISDLNQQYLGDRLIAEFTVGSVRKKLNS